MDYKLVLNERLEEKLIHVPVGDHVAEYCPDTVKNGTKYLFCNQCNATAVLYGDGDLWASPHLDTCQLKIKEKAEADQAERRAKLLVSKGVKSQDAYDIHYAECVKNGCEVYYKAFFQMRKQLSRIYGKKLADSTLGQTAAEYCFFPNTNVRWLLKETREFAIFATDNMLRTMASASVLVVDGTFSIRPAEVEKGQILTIHALVAGENGEEWVPVAMAVLSSHEQVQYEAVVNAIKEKWQELGIEPTFGRIHCDYEQGLMNAMKLLDTADKVYGCHFHSSQAIYRAVVDCKLFRHYMDGKRRGHRHLSAIVLL
uniref:MULE transposase domain-containing protein n=1 Tax=Panagrolaimus davidi TaxID=227884 RepID=A0A914Q9D6_9BILA